MARRMRAEGGMNSKMLHPYRAHFKSETPIYRHNAPAGRSLPYGQTQAEMHAPQSNETMCIFSKGIERQILAQMSSTIGLSRSAKRNYRRSERERENLFERSELFSL